MKELIINIDKNGCAVSNGYGGVSSEHLATKITVHFEEPPNAEYYRMFFKSGNSQIYTQELFLQGNTVSYIVPNSVTVLGKNIVWQLYGYKMNGNNYELLYLSDSLSIYFGDPISAGGIQADDDFQSSLEEIIDNIEEFSNQFDIDVTSVETVEPTDDADVEIEKSGYNFGLSFSIPKGQKGDKGDKGDNGISGSSPIIISDIPQCLNAYIDSNNHIKTPGPTREYFRFYPKLKEGNTAVSASLSASISNPPGTENTDYGFTLHNSGMVDFWISQFYTFSRETPLNCSISVSMTYNKKTYTQSVPVNLIFDGLNGQNGVDGQNGTDGIDGADGVDGVNGIDGTSPVTIQGLPDFICVPVENTGVVKPFEVLYSLKLYKGDTEVSVSANNITIATSLNAHVNADNHPDQSYKSRLRVKNNNSSIDVSNVPTNETVTVTFSYDNTNYMKVIHLIYVIDGQNGSGGGAVNTLTVGGQSVVDSSGNATIATEGEYNQVSNKLMTKAAVNSIIGDIETLLGGLL